MRSIPSEGRADRVMLEGRNVTGRSLLWKVSFWLLLVATPILVLVVILVAGPSGAGRQLPNAEATSLFTVLLAIVVVVVSCSAGGYVARLLKQPAVIGEIAAGVVLGPSVLGHLWPRLVESLFPPAVLTAMNVLASIGVILFVFLAGLDVEIDKLRGFGHLTAIVSATSMTIPLLLGALFAVAADAKFGANIDFVPFVLFIGLAMSVTALPVLARIIEDSPLRGTNIAAVAMTAATADDVVAWLLLALVLGLVSTGAGGATVAVVLTGVFIAVLFWVVRPALRAMLSSGRFSVSARVAILLVGLVLAAAITDWIGVHSVLGAFLFGLAVPRVGNVVSECIQHVRTPTATLLLPLFFALSGLRTDLTALGTDRSQWAWCLAAICVAVISKIGGTFLAAGVAGAPTKDSLLLGILMNCRGMTELVVLNIGLDAGLIGKEMFTVLVVTAFACTAMTGPAISWASPARR